MRRSLELWGSASLVGRLLLILLGVGGCLAPIPTEEAEKVLWNVDMIDGTGAAPIRNQALILRAGRIVEIGHVDDVRIPARAEIFEFEGCTVVPGFIDLHVHFPEDLQVQQAILDQLLDYGITTVLNPGARPGAGVELRERVARCEFRGPRIVTAGPIIDHPPLERAPTSWFVYVDDEEAMRAEVRAQLARGVDWIKLYEHLPPSLVRAGIEEAHSSEVPVVLHAGETTWGEAARLGVDMLVHSGYATPMEELIELEDPAAVSDDVWYRAYANAPAGLTFAQLARTLLDEDVTLVPTLSITQAGGLGFDARLLPDFRTDLAPDADLPGWWMPGWRERHPQTGELDPGEEVLLEEVYFPGVLGIVRAYFERGVRLGVGTDVGNSWMTPGFVYHHELELYQRAGIPPLEILTMATRNGAEALGRLDDVGTIELGKRADLVVLKGNPAEDIRFARDIEAVLLGGRFVEGP